MTEVSDSVQPLTAHHIPAIAAVTNITVQGVRSRVAVCLYKANQGIVLLRVTSVSGPESGFLSMNALKRHVKNQQQRR